MDNIRNVIKNLFCYISVEEILSGDDVFQNITKDLFRKLGNSYQMYYGNEELDNMYSYMADEFVWQNKRITSTEAQKDAEDKKWNVFNALITFDFQVLVEENNEPLCQYIHLLRWRELITSLEEDILITSFLAKKDIVNGKKRRNFFWKPVIGHNNFALNRLMTLGIAENHFHLKGSAPLFHLSWISLMNDIGNSKFEKHLMEYDINRLQRPTAYGGSHGSVSYSTMWRQAGLIRLFLFCVIMGDYLPISEVYTDKRNLQRLCSQEDYEKVRAYWKSEGLGEESEVELSALEKINLSPEVLIQLRKEQGEEWVSELIHNPEKLDECVRDIQTIVNKLKERYQTLELDYTLCGAALNYNPERGVNEVISGERWFMYEMFLRIYGQRDFSPRYQNWFYLYLVIKTQIRMEIVQCNYNVGFDNFKRFQDRKDKFVEDTLYEEIYVKMAVRDTIYNQHIVSLEARIAPKDDARQDAETIKKYDRWICKNLKEEEKKRLKSKYFYVYHFIKEPEEEGETGECRNWEKRKKVREQAVEIAKMRDQGYEEAKRVRGIDASSSEIGCRPEVFAQAFRFLKDHIPQDEDGFVWRDGNLMATYHVGEDFLDVIDGLRAIDEAIHFLNLRCGDRLGHALALGVDAVDWYRSKSGRILISKQDYLDNLVWLYGKIRKYNIKDASDAQNYIEKRFQEYFQEIYLNNLSKQERDKIVKEAREYFEKENITHRYINDDMRFGIHEYYDAWKLRGDDPEIYRHGFAELSFVRTDKWEDYAVDKSFPLNYPVRYSPEVAVLYYMYHFNVNVRKIGAETVEVKVQDSIVNAVKIIQKKLQNEIAEMGIGIETNPSSNYLIGTFRRYDKHPIVSWYNLSLIQNDDEVRDCPQIQVSINTDDQGVFATYLENEYAYMALALEKYKDDEGKRIYKRSCIMQWLNNIRKMGISQSFQKNDVLRSKYGDEELYE